MTGTTGGATAAWKNGTGNVTFDFGRKDRASEEQEEGSVSALALTDTTMERPTTEMTGVIVQGDENGNAAIGGGRDDQQPGTSGCGRDDQQPGTSGCGRDGQGPAASDLVQIIINPVDANGDENSVDDSDSNAEPNESPDGDEESGNSSGTLSESSSMWEWSYDDPKNSRYPRGYWIFHGYLICFEFSQAIYILQFPFDASKIGFVGLEFGDNEVACVFFAVTMIGLAIIMGGFWLIRAKFPVVAALLMTNFHIGLMSIIDISNRMKYGLDHFLQIPVAILLTIRIVTIIMSCVYVYLIGWPTFGDDIPPSAQANEDENDV